MYYRFKDGVQFELTPDGGILHSADETKEVYVDKERSLFLKQLVECTAKDGAIALSVFPELYELNKNNDKDEETEDSAYFKTIEIMKEYIAAGFVERDLEAEKRSAE